MTAVWAWFRIDLRRRWRSLVVLGLLIALASGTVLTAIAGARRGASALDRLLDDTLPLDAVVLPNEPDFPWDEVRALPEVTAMSGFALATVRLDGVPETDWAVSFAPTDAAILDTIERAVVLEGRRLDPTRVDEVVITPLSAEYYGFEVGDTVTLRLMSPEQVDAEVAGEAPGELAGPAIEATIVGIIRSLWARDQPGDVTGSILPSPAVFATYPDSFLGAAGTGWWNAILRLENGRQDLPRFRENVARIGGRSDIDIWDASEWVAHYDSVTRFEAASLFVFALAAAVAAIFIVGQAVARHVTATLGDLEPLRAVGMTPAETRRAVALGPALAAIGGAAVGAVVAMIASRWFPIGSASTFEPNPGVDVDMAVLAGGFVLVVGLVVGGATALTGLVLRAQTSVLPPRRSTVAAAAVRAGMPVPVVVGARFALEPGRGRTAVPVRPALLGAVIGILGVLAALTLSRGIDDAVQTPERWGTTYEFGAFVGINGFDFIPTDEMLPAIAADPDVAGINDARMDVARIGDVSVSVFTLDPVENPIDVVVERGREPGAPNDIALGPRTAEAAGLDVGDQIEVIGSAGSRTMTVSGIAFVPAGPHNDYATGAWTTAAAYDQLFDGHKFHFALIDVADGVDPAAVAERLAAVGLEVQPPEEPPEAFELRQVRAIPLVLAGFLVVLALGAVGHALATAVRRRSHDVVVLRALGMTRGQSRLIVTTQATLLALVGLVAGIPLGIALGRSVWRFVAQRTPLFYLAPETWLLLAATIPLAIVTTNLLAVAPSRRAARLQIAQVLRAE